MRVCPHACMQQITVFVSSFTCDKVRYPEHLSHFQNNKVNNAKSDRKIELMYTKQLVPI